MDFDFHPRDFTKFKHAIDKISIKKRDRPRPAPVCRFTLEIFLRAHGAILLQ
ncbi:MAG: hypothetical protein L0Y57_06285 [Beijerinckiaceae bacterium]|nr:hypothetical protein [Beijerinckiaceae bacterium]